jgi:hypothetical protein
LDSEGNVYVNGEAGSGNFPVMNPLQGYGGGTDGFLTKISADGSALVYSTYLGGSGSDKIFDVAFDAADATYVAGYTGSTNFPTVNPLQPSHGGGSRDCFVAKITPQGSALVYSTYLGGSGTDECRSIAADSAGSAYVTGDTTSTDFPSVNAAQPTHGGGLTDAFVTKINAEGSAIVYSTFLGGNSEEESNGLKLIAVDAAGNAYVTGATRSFDFPTVNPLQPIVGGKIDAFLAKIEPGGSALLYSTYLGGSSDDDGLDVVLDATGDVYVSGRTFSTNFPTREPVQPIHGGKWDAFVAKVRGDGSALIFSTFFGGSSDDRATALALDAAGNPHFTGQTLSPNLPLVNPLQPSSGGSYEAYVARIDMSQPSGLILDLRWAAGAKTSLEWGAVPETVAYQVYRGVRGDLPKLLDTNVDSCTRLSTAATASGPVLTEQPSPGTFDWYLVRAESVAGLGPAGYATVGPRIQDSSGSCP